MSKAVLDLPKRPARVAHINTRLEKHGESSVLCADIKIEGVHLEPDELNLLLDDKHAHNALFVTAKGKATEPMFRQLKRFELESKFEDCSASIFLGLSDDSVDFEDVKVAKVKLSPQVGGQTMVELTVQTEIEDTNDIASLLEHLDSEACVAITFGAKSKPEGKKAQKDLGLGVTATKTSEDAAGDGAEAVH